ncbi:MAG: hypothetical protein ABIH26_14060, partial [Candidatus Eisenbacteria bacterium]
MNRRLRPPACLLAIVSLIAGAALCRATTITKQLEFERPLVAGAGPTCLASIEGLPEFGDPGEPILPSYPLCVLLPQGEEVSSVTCRERDSEEIRLERDLIWGQPQAPLSMEESWEPVEADPKIYRSAETFPAARSVHVT